MSRLFIRASLSWLIVVSALLGARPVAATADDGDAAWAAIRQGYPADQPLYRATWLPGRFGAPQYNTNPHGIVYRGEGDERLTFTFSLNADGALLQAPPNTSPYQVHGQSAYFLGPKIGPDNQLAPPFVFEIGWQEAGTIYRVRLENPRQPGSAGGDLVLIADSLAPVGGDGAVAPQCFAATGQCIVGRFLARWLAYGGLARNGYPLTGEFRQMLEDGQEYTVQYFERVRLEWHPENDPFEQVQLGQFGRRVFRARSGREADPPVPQAGPIYFTETGHNLSGPFLDYWQQNGGISQFGQPLTEPFPERLRDGNIYTVQYFERARFEYHPENAPPYDVLLGQFGRQILATDVR